MRGQRKKLAQLARLWASNKLQTQEDEDAARPGHFDEALAAWGLQRSDEPDASAVDTPENVFYIWPKSVKTWAIWQRLQSMWRSGMDGRCGLDWPSVTTWLHHAERMGKKDVADTMQVLRAMEVAALNVWAEQREKQAAKKA